MFFGMWSQRKESNPWDPCKVEEIKSCLMPKSISDVRIFHALSFFYTENFSRIVDLLTNCKKKENFLMVKGCLTFIL